MSGEARVGSSEETELRAPGARGDDPGHDSRPVVANRDVLERRVGGEVLLLRRAGDHELQRLAGVTAATWLVLDRPALVADLVAEAVEVAAGVADPAVVESAVRGAVQVLLEADLIHRVVDEDDEVGR